VVQNFLLLMSSRKWQNLTKGPCIYIITTHAMCTGEIFNWADGGPNPLVLAQHSQEAQPVERPAWEAGLGG
jgi:hypothetical protein